MTNTVPNVSRYRVEKTGRGFWPYCVRAGDGTREVFVGYQKQCAVVAAELETAFEDGKFVSCIAPSPAGVGGLELDRNEAYQACPDSGCDWGSFWQGWKARHAGAQAIIDGLRGEVAQLQSMLATVSKAGIRVRTDRDQQAQRIGELEGLLRDERAYGPLGVSCQNGVVARCVCRMCRLRHIEAALSAVKDSDQ